MSYQIKRFFDAAIAEPAGTYNIAELMARQGQQTIGEPASQPIVIKTETPPTAPAPEPPPVATTTAAQPAEPAKTEPPSLQTEPTVVPPTQTAPEPAKVQTWQEVLKQQPDTVLKEIGLDADVVNLSKQIKDNPQMAAFFKHWKDNGDVTSYLRELSTDYTKMPSDEVMRHQLRTEYPKATPKQLEYLFQEKVMKAYNLDSEDPEILERGKELLEAEADRHRDKFVDNQKKFLIPKPPEPKAAEPDLQAQQQQQFVESYKSKMGDDPLTKNIIATKQFSYGEGDDKFNYPVDPNVLMNFLYDPSQYVTTMFNVQDNGADKSYTPNVEHQLLVATVAKYGKNFMTEYAKHYKSIGGKSAIAPIENASPPAGGTPAAAAITPQTPAEAMAKGGRLVN